MHNAAADFRVIRVDCAKCRITGIKTAIESWIFGESGSNGINLVISLVIIEVELYQDVNKSCFISCHVEPTSFGPMRMTGPPMKIR